MTAQTSGTNLSPLERPLSAGELDLIPECAKVLQEAGLGQEVQASFLANDLIQKGAGKCVEAQRFFLNRFWNKQLSELQNRAGVSTLDHRFCLLDKGKPEDWVSVFKEMIVPCAMEHRLPAALA